MGFIPLEDAYIHNAPNGIEKVPTDVNGDFSSFQITHLASEQVATPTGMKEEIVLLSWLMVLLRSREDSQISYDWSHKDFANGVEPESVNKLLMNEVMKGLQSNVGEVATAISRNISTAASSPSSLLLSTSSLSRTSEEAKDEKGIIHLEVRFNNAHLEIRPLWHTENMLPYTVNHHVEALADTIRVCLTNPEATIEQCLRPTTSDLNDIWGWNHELPPTYSFCMQEMVAERAREYPDKVAIDSWDGSLTYSQIDQWSTSVACSLKEMGVELHDVLPVCFEKSRWTIVAVLGVMKAGATLALMDPTLPLARLQNMAVQVGAKSMVSSRKQHELSLTIMPTGNHFVVEEDAFTNPSNSPSISVLPTVPSSALMYIIFTSGSTGTPKGVKISHETYTSSAIPRAKAVGYTPESRVLDFASYAFDVSIDSMLLTLGNGGCLCIPSDEDRLNDINEVIRKMRINYAGLTPSVGRILDADVIASLSGLGLGGEAVSARDANNWGKETRIIIGYGPCECTIGCTVNGSAATGRDYLSIGPGNGAAMWIANPNDHNELVPVGSVGELLVEGPIVGQGYLNDPEKTAAAFINDPPWLVAGHKNYAGRRGRLYKTGDLGRYDPDGLGGIVFVGRKDTQVKLRGQRVELGEIESQLKAVLPSEANVIAEVINPKDYGGQAMLVAFVAFQPKGHGQAELALDEISSELNSILTKANADVAKTLPRYMVPTTYIPVNLMPVLISGKTDRKQLRAFGATVDLRQLDQGAASTASRELNELEKRLRQAWAETLKLDAEAIRPDDNFFALGGDSLAAMRLVSVCRAQDLDLSVISTFGNPTLSAMATIVQPCTSQVQEEIPAFSLISQSVESARLEAAQACGVDQENVQDIYLCTPTQESLFTFSLKSTKAYIAQRVACIPSDISLDAWKKAWEDVVAASPILRSRLAPLQDPGLQQIVVKEDVSWRYSTDLDQYLENDRSEKMNLGQSLARYGLVSNANDDKRYMVWTVHHVLYDGWSEPIVLKQVSDALQNQSVEIQTQMRNFVKYVRDTDEAAMHDFWRRELKGAVGPQFPRLPSRDFMPTPNGLIEHQISLETGAGSPFTMATLIRGAWALVASQYTGSDDVVFGETLTGRDISLPGVESIVGPLIATIPIRIQVRRSSSVESYLQMVQHTILARTPYQHMGMQNIRKVSQDAQYACEAGTGLVIQPDPEYVGSELGFKLGDVVREALHFNPYPLMVAFGIRKGGLRVCASFDSSLIEGSQMQRILAQLDTACVQLSKGLDKRIDEISCLPETEVDQIWQWNQAPPLSVDETSGNLRAHASTKQGSVYPRVVIPWVCDARNPDLLSPIGSVGELWLEGACLSGETVESPAWLVAGSSGCAGRSGKVQPTGDMVQLQGDGSLVFVGRKENVVPLQGHAVDIADLELHFEKHLPSATRAAASVFQPLREGTQKVTEQELAVFIESQPSQEDSVRVMPARYEMVGEETTICDTISVTLAVSLKKLDKFIRDSLPSYMAPSAYVVVDKLPAGLEQFDHASLNKLASKIPQSVLEQLRGGFKEAWTKGLAQTKLSPPEKILQSAWANILRLSPEQIDVDDNFFRLGGDSVLAMKLVSSLRTQGHSLSVADIFQHMRLGDAAKVLKVDQVKEKATPYKPFSALSNLDVKLFLSSTVRPKLANPGWPIEDVSPITDSQALDIRGTIGAPRTSIQYTMLYFDQNINREQLLRACNDLVKTHDILRTVFIEHESSFLQVVLQDAHAPVVMHQADKEIEQYVTELCTADIESNFELGSPFLKIFHVQGTEGKHCLVLGLSHAQYDGVSLPRLLQDLETLYAGGKVVDFEPFASYMARVSDGRLQTQAVNYWGDLLKDSTLSVLYGASAQPTDKAIFHERAVEEFQPVPEITTANVLTAAWALVLARRLGKPDVTFGTVTSGRTIDLANVENVMGPCYQLTPVRVKFESQWTAMDLLRFVQKQSAESAAHDFLGFEKISKQCAQWSPEARSFDSIVHHQDWDDFDDMPFAGSSCKVDISNPHGDAAYPLKAVSFVRGGKMHVGFVGSERDATFVDATLDELAAAVQELSGCRSEPLVIDA
ncbi:AMP-dependent synthetase/ligase [Penicillium concentricum]|uniref:AMP-dependent synthetase/ligase n=1 Tax=Penicillium concentricum TaxID=293559 RepID=A0A9W9S6W9_9EURO|nr:AMP-dependent synthetase/ligase [Penicillium concentricum]KAJ5373177.1 AMP-dependent synthetase/ligase [Penicillium concentricum]